MTKPFAPDAIAIMDHLKPYGCILIGLVAGSCVNMAFVMLSVKVLYPTEVNFEDLYAFNEYIAKLPWQAFVII